MTVNGYTSRNIPDPKIYADMLEQRMQAKKNGDTTTANSLKLIANTTYGATLNKFNDLYDPLMARSVCISGQLYLLELANHLLADVPDLKVVELNTDGIMVEFDDFHYDKVLEITEEWQKRTHFDLEEDSVSKLVKRDVNNYVEVQYGGSVKIKGGVLVRGISKAGAFNVNNNATVVARAVKDFFASGIPVEETINNCNNLLDFQLVSKCGGSYTGCFWQKGNEYEAVQKVNRVYACNNLYLGTIFKKNRTSGNLEKIAGLPLHCAVDNDNQSFPIENLDRNWYIRLARKQCNEFLGIKPPKRNTRKVNLMKKNILKLLEENNGL